MLNPDMIWVIKGYYGLSSTEIESRSIWRIWEGQFRSGNATGYAGKADDPYI